MVLRWRIDD